ncbi:hypothetical protein EDD17DRAFT_1535626, partial [Pisolithus thermaeus]
TSVVPLLLLNLCKLGQLSLTGSAQAGLVNDIHLGQSRMLTTVRAQIKARQRCRDYGTSRIAVLQGLFAAKK